MHCMETEGVCVCVCVPMKVSFSIFFDLFSSSPFTLRQVIRGDPIMGPIEETRCLSCGTPNSPPPPDSRPTSK